MKGFCGRASALNMVHETIKYFTLPQRYLGIVGLLIIWQVSAQVWQPAALPSVVAVVNTMWAELDSGALLFHISITLQRVFFSFIGAMLVGVPLGLTMAHCKTLDAWLDSLVTLLMNIPALVIIILCFLWIGLNELGAIVAVVINKAPMITVTLREGGRAVDKDLLAVAKVFRVNRWQQFRSFYLPQLYPYLLAATRTGLAMVWKIVLVVELLGCSEGIGFKLGLYFQYFDIAGILAYALAFVLLIMLIESQMIRRWERWVMRWRQ